MVLNLENAPVPRPNAPAAPAVGEVREDVGGDMALKGLLALWEVVSPALLPMEPVKLGFESLEGRVPFVEEAAVDRESLPLLEK